MAKVSVSARIASTPERTWSVAADLTRFDEWLVLHEAWRSPIPPEITHGTTFTSVVSVKGFRNRITWRVESYDEPSAMSISGDGVGGVRIALSLGIRPVDSGSEVSIDADVRGKPVFGPVGMAIGRAVRGELRRSITNLSALIG
ncbi:type II toxin-antitoxin system Rv0910 family toxin [Amycolatopsis lurida]